MSQEREKALPELRGDLFVFPGRILFLGEGLFTDFHAHHASSLLVATEEESDFGPELDGAELWNGAGILLGPGVRHRLIAEKSRMLVLQIVPEMHRFALPRLHELKPADLKFIRTLARDLGGLHCNQAATCLSQILSRFPSNAGSAARNAAALDPRITASLARIQDSLPEILTVAELSIQAGLSEHRFMHLFKSQVGIPVRRYALWARMQRAAFLLQDGRTLTEAAHEAGFSDSAHMSRSFKDFFGISPSSVFGERASVKARFCNGVG